MALLTIEIEDAPDGHVLVRTDPPNIPGLALQQRPLTGAEGYALHAFGSLLDLAAVAGQPKEQRH